MRILLLASSFSGMVQRVKTELLAHHHVLEEHYNLEPHRLRAQVQRFKPEVILCPYLTQKIPADIWQQYLCLIVHPGIEGDRGASSLDWALTLNEEEWGVTLLQAAGDYDAGDIWGTRRFPMRAASKTSLYKREVTHAAVELIHQALTDIHDHHFKPRPLDYDAPHVRGAARPIMKQKQRVIDWQHCSTAEAMSKLRAADSRPGVHAKINGHDVYLYGGKVESHLRGAPGDILAVHKGAFCCATQDGAVWIRQLKCTSSPDLPPIKLPAAQVLEKICTPQQLEQTHSEFDRRVIDDIRVDYRDDVAYVYFDFYNGAMNTRQCIDLKSTLIEVKQQAVRMIVLMGGEDFFSNGIHLHCIEASADPAQESWRNINAINDVVLEILNSPQHLTVGVLRNNAGAGGAIMALACDEVVARGGVVLNPHYQSMGLTGSEYYSYLLPKRVGAQTSERLLSACEPLLAHAALELGFVDTVFEESWEVFHQQLFDYCQHLGKIMDFDEFLAVKARQRTHDEGIKPLHAYRQEELAAMKRIFFDAASTYHTLRRGFVYGEQVHQRALAPTAKVV